MEERRKDYGDIFRELTEIKVIQGRTEERLIAVDRRVNGSIGSFEHHIENSSKRNIAIVLVFLGMFWALMGFASSLGEYKKQVEINTKIIEEIK